MEAIALTPFPDKDVDGLHQAHVTLLRNDETFVMHILSDILARALILEGGFVEEGAINDSKWGSDWHSGICRPQK